MSNRVISWLTPESMHHAAIQMRDQAVGAGQQVEQQIQLIAECSPSRYAWQWVGYQSMRHLINGPFAVIGCRCGLPNRPAPLRNDPGNPMGSSGPEGGAVIMSPGRYRFHGSPMNLWFGRCQRCSTCYYHSDAAPADGMLPNVPHGEFSIAADLLEEHGFPEIAAAVRRMERTPAE